MPMDEETKVRLSELDSLALWLRDHFDVVGQPDYEDVMHYILHRVKEITHQEIGIQC
jgi:hypothetical protein